MKKYIDKQMILNWTKTLPQVWLLYLKSTKETISSSRPLQDLAHLKDKHRHNAK